MLGNEPRPKEMYEHGLEQRLLASENKRPPMEHIGFASLTKLSEPNLKKEEKKPVVVHDILSYNKRKKWAASRISKEQILRQENSSENAFRGVDEVSHPGALESKEVLQQSKTADTAKEERKMLVDEAENSQKKKRISCRDIADILLATDDWRKEDRLLLHYEKDKGFWRVIPKSNENYELRCCFDGELADEINKNTLSEIYEWLLVDAPLFPAALSANSTDYINLLDVAIDWRDGYTTVHKRKKLYFRYYLNISSDDIKNARNGSFKSFLRTVYPDEKETKREFMKFTGLALSGFRAEKTAVIIHGPSSTGKSVFLGLLEKLMGEELTASVSFSQIAQDFAITQLLGKSLSISGEISGTSNKRLDVFKSVTGRDKLTMSFKGKDHFQSRFYCMLVFASNVFPQIADVRELNIFLQRVQIFPFDNVIPRSEWIPNLEEVLYEDRGAILEFAMKGLREWEADGCQFIESKEMREKKMEFKRESNSFALFLEEYAYPNPMSRATHREINQRYQEFCLQEGLVPLNGNVWPIVLKESWSVKSVIIETRDPNTKEVSRSRGYQGIELSNTPYDYYASSQIFGADAQNS